MRILKLFLSRLKANNFWRSVAVLVSGTAFAQILGVITTPIVSRLYDPNAFGQYAIIISTSTIILSIVALGLNSAVMVASSDGESKEVLMVGFITILVLSTIVLIVMIMATPFIRFFKPEMNYIFASILVYLFVVINGLRGLLNVYANRKGMNRVLFYNSLISALATLFITIPMGMLRLGGLGLLLAAIIGGVLSIIQMVYHAKPFIRIPKISIFKNVYIKYREFVLYQYPSNFIENFAIQLPTQVFSATFGNANLGSYSMNEKILGIPIRMIGAPINTIYFRTASEYHKQGKDLADFTFSLMVKTMLIALLAIIVTVMWGEQIFSFALGSNWSEAGRLAGFLILQYVFMFCATCTSYCRVVIGKQKINLAVSIFRLAIILVSIFLGIFLFGDLFRTIIFFSLGSSVYFIIDMAVNFYCLKKYWVKYTAFALIYILVIVILWMVAGKLN